jgi:hypothetical protein
VTDDETEEQGKVRFAKQTFDISTTGIWAVTSHEKGKKHEIAVRNVDPTG